MRILYLSQLMPLPPNAGPKVRIYHVLQYLAAAGHDVTLVAFSRADDSQAGNDQLQRCCRQIFTVPMVRSPLRDLWHLARSLLNGQPLLIARDHRKEMVFLVQQLAATERFDAIHADQLWMAQYALVASRAQAVQLVLDQHNATFLVPLRLAEHEPNRLKRLLLRREARAMRRYEISVCQKFDQVTWVTHEDRVALSSAAGHSAGNWEQPQPVIPICVDPDAKRVIKRRRDARRITFLGGLHWPPNAAGIVWFARTVWPLVQARFNDVCLTIIGKRPPPALLQLAAADKQVDVRGYVADLSPLLQESAVFIVPLHAGGGMRVKIIDAWSWGLPVVSTTVGAEGVDGRPNQNLLIADDAESFAAAIMELLTNPDMAQRLAMSGRHTVEQQYDWRKTYRAWDAVYPPPRSGAI